MNHPHAEALKVLTTNTPMSDFDKRMTAQDPLYPARGAALTALHKHIDQWFKDYEFDDGESFSHSPSEFEQLLIADAFHGLTADESYLRLYSAWRALCPARATTHASLDVLAERQRQIDAEGWTPEHDDEHDEGEMALAGAAYAISGGITANTAQDWIDSETPECWPWDESWWKRTTPRRDLVKAAALILAEIERIDRTTPAQAVQPS